MNTEIVSSAVKDFLLSHGYAADFEISTIAGAGSGRKYYRIASGDRSCVLQVSAVVDDDFKRFVDYSETFAEYGLPVPRVYFVDEASCSVLQEDLGAHNLLDNIFPAGADKRSGNVRILYPEVIEALIKWQQVSRSLFSSHSDIWLRRFDFAALKWETDYFTENYLKAHKAITEIPESVRNFYSMLALSVDAQPKALMHRDFQSQNIMVKPDSEIAFVDYQGARRGSMFYDLASLLWDPYVCLSLAEIKDFFEYWRTSFRGTKTYTQQDAWEAFVYASLQRVMQAMGAYCFLSKVKGIQKFEQYIEPGKAQLRVLFSEFKKIAKATSPEVFEFMDKALA
ncbi:MAG: phosphotransferase [Fibrobacter sp.]|nr:phosphotransferase [Fibrobacter sp.]